MIQYVHFQALNCVWGRSKDKNLSKKKMLILHLPKLTYKDRVFQDTFAKIWDNQW